MRRKDWMMRLADAVESVRALPFAYGLHDCCTFTAHCLDKMCDTDLMARMQSEDAYTDEEGAYARIAAAGGLQALITKYLGEPMPNALFAAPGDVALAENGDGREIIGVIIGHQIIAPAAPRGVLALPIAQMRAAWKV